MDSSSTKRNRLYVIKQNKIVRVLAFPVVNMIRFERKICYRFTAQSKKVRAYRNCHMGERCFIIGNGPSLTVQDLNALKGEHCFAANRIYQMFEKTDWRPEYYLCVDSFVLRDIKEKISELENIDIFVHLEGKKYTEEKKNNITYINNYYPYYVNQYKRIKDIRVSEDVSKYFIAGETVTFNAIQFAIYMGFREIYLLGVDHRYSRYRDKNGNIVQDQSIQDYFDNMPSKDYCVQNVQASTAAYQSAREYCDRHGIIIKNLTRGGALEVFERADFDEVVARKY